MSTVSVRMWSLGLILLLGSGPLLARAGVYPPALTLNPNTGPREDTVVVTNVDARDVRYRLRVDAAAMQTADETPVSTGNTAPASWFTFTPRDFTLAAGAEQAVRVKVRASGRVAAGVYQARVQVEPCEPAGDPTLVLVTVKIDPVVAIRVPQPAVEAQGDNGRLIAATVQYVIEANVPRVRLYAEVSPLYLGMQWSKQGPFIPLEYSRGVKMAPVDAVPIPLAKLVADYIGPGNGIDAYPVQRTEILTFESRQPNGFNQDVFVTVCWQQDDVCKPAGQYGGKIRLTVLVMPDL